MFSFATYCPLLCRTNICCCEQGSQVPVCCNDALVITTGTSLENTGIDF